jgi:hypothetical protein
MKLQFFSSPIFLPGFLLARAPSIFAFPKKPPSQLTSFLFNSPLSQNISRNV